MTVSNEVISGKVCSACGTEVRAESAYCYHCGDEVHTGGLKSNTGERIKPARNGSRAATVDDSIVDSTSVPRTLNQKRRRKRKRVHVVWERTDGPGYLLLLFAGGVALLVLGLLAAAAYLQ